MKSRKSFYIGRWQPLHAGHIELIDTAIREGKEVMVGVMDTDIDEYNPYTFEDRKKMFEQQFGDSVEVVKLPPIGEVCFGRNVGYRIRHINLPPEIQAISGTKIRNGEIKL